MKLQNVVYRDHIGASLLAILAFEGFGIRFLDGVIPSPIIWWTVLLALMNWKYVIQMKFTYWGKTLLLVAFYVIFNLIKGAPIEMFIFPAWLSAAIVLTRYVNRRDLFIEDIRKLSFFCMWYHLLHILVCFVFSGFFYQLKIDDYPYTTFSYLFWYGGHGFNEFGLLRPCGFAWEPSCWNIFLNLNLVFQLYKSKNKKNIVLAIVSILFTFSTTALVTMFAILSLFYFYKIKSKDFVRYFFTGGIVLLMVYLFVSKNFTEKMGTGSGQARGGDFVMAAAVLRKNPIMGENLNNIANVTYAMNARENYWTADTNNQNLQMAAGMTNGFAGLLVEWGLIISLVVFYCTLKTPLIEDKKLKWLYLLAMFMVLMGSPISRTGFFYVYPFSFILLNRKKGFFENYTYCKE